jgi:hypothetical protein
MFKRGEVVRVLEGKYKGQQAMVTDIHFSHAPLLYSARVGNGKEIAAYEHELEAVKEEAGNASERTS